jgi:hypothetical protein
MTEFNNKSLFMALLLFATCSLRLHADPWDDDFASGGYAQGGGEYLKLPVQAQAAGLEGSTVAWRDGLAGLQYNPAILDAVDSISALGATSFMTFDRTHFGVDAASPIGDFLVAGLSFSQFGVGKMEGRDDFGIVTNSFSASFNALSATVAGRLSIPLSFGLRARYIFESIDNEHSNGTGFDAGATYQPIPQLCIGASVQNIGSYVWWSTGTRDEVLMTGRLGACGILLDNTLRIELDLVKTLRQPEEALLGAEYRFLDLFFARAGIKEAVITDTRTIMKPEYSFGAGMRYEFVGFDYAMVMPVSGLGAIHKISIAGKLPGF